MKILILGISGRTGRLVAAEALKRGHQVAGITRDKSKVSIPGADIIEGTPYDYETVRIAIEGCDAVMSTLNLFTTSQGFFSKPSTPLDTMSVSMRNTVMAMEEKGLKRIVVMTSFGVGDSAAELPWVFSFISRISSIRYVFADHAAQEKVLERSSLDWTVVRPVGLTDKNELLRIKVRVNGEGKLGGTVSRNAVAHFMLDCLEKGDFIRQKPGISNI